MHELGRWHEEKSIYTKNRARRKTRRRSRKRDETRSGWLGEYVCYTSARGPNRIRRRPPERADELVGLGGSEDVGHVLRVGISPAELAQTHVDLEELGLRRLGIDAVDEDALFLVGHVEEAPRVVERDVADGVEVFLRVRDRVEKHRRRVHEGVDDVALGEVWLEDFGFLDAFGVDVVETPPAERGFGVGVDVIVVLVVQEQVDARHQVDVDEQHVEDDAQVHREVWRSRRAVEPRVDAHVAEAEGLGEKLAGGDPVDLAAAVGRDGARAGAVVGLELVRRGRRVEPRRRRLELGHALLAEREAVVLDDLPQPLVHGPVLPREDLADEALEPRRERADARTFVDARPAPDVRLELAPRRDRRDVHRELLAIQQPLDLLVRQRARRQGCRRRRRRRRASSRAATDGVRPLVARAAPGGERARDRERRR
mmetsp:Transcript_2931/g.11155  ORF Transcript_2931/g.11155 Transcript_2931/m.11155 type:complete len:427 (+) Transcript_2931:61-1341(+)